MLKLAAAIGAALLLAACAVAEDDEDPRPFDSGLDASAQIDSALERAREQGRGVFLVFGANWCHDSRGLAGKIERDEDLAAIIEAAYVLEFVDVGERDRNLDQLARFGVEHIFGTPTLLIVDPRDERVVNAETVHDWRMVYDASAADVTAYLAAAAGAAIDPLDTTWADVETLASAWPGHADALDAIAAYEAEARAGLAADDADAHAALDAEVARRQAFARAYARAFARFSMGRVGRRDGHAIIARASLSDADPDRDATADVAAFMAERDTSVPDDFGLDD